MLFPIKQGLFKYDLEDHYAVLGAPLDTDSKQIRDRYLKIALKLHPDTCKAPTEQERLLANQILSKLVNPAYKILNKGSSRAEFLLITAQLSKNLVSNRDNLSWVSESARQLSQAPKNADLMYYRLLNPLLTQQYEDLEHFCEITAQISELNLVYLILKQGGSNIRSSLPQPDSEAQAAADSLASGRSIQPRNTPNPENPAPEKAVTTPLENALKRAREQMERHNYSQVVAELQEVLKIHPNNSTGHALIGMAYLGTNQVTMAKVHINRAIAVDPQNSTAKQAKQALNKISPNSEDSSSEKNKGGLFGKFFGNPPNKN